MRSLFLLFFLALSATAYAAPPADFERAKTIARTQVYHDRNTSGDLYCGCNWQWVGQSGGRTDLAGCGYKIRAQANRAQRTEWEHVVPASTFGRQRQCWQNGGRANCTATDPVFSLMEADLHNLTPVVGEVNADRSNFNVGMVATPAGQYGQCPFKVDFQSRVAEPPNAAKGQVARIHFYMAARYGLSLSEQQQRVLIAWDRAYPPTAWEVERDRRIARIMGHHNGFVTGAQRWELGNRTTPVVPRPAVAPQPARPAPAAAPAPRPAQAPAVAPAQTAPPVIGNRNSNIYHVRGSCPGYEATAPQNRVAFASEAAAVAAGFRKAGNCR